MAKNSRDIQASKAGGRTLASIRARHLSCLLAVACPVALAAMLVAIWALTIQTPSQTIALSDIWSNAISTLCGIDHDRASWIARKVVHTCEFLPVGLLLALTLSYWGRMLPWHKKASGHSNLPKRPTFAGAGRLTWRAVAFACMLCLVCSFGDQVHKTFVPGREFDALDMCFDAAGYLIGIWVAWLLTHRRGRAEAV